MTYIKYPDYSKVLDLSPAAAEKEAYIFKAKYDADARISAAVKSACTTRKITKA